MKVCERTRPWLLLKYREYRRSWASPELSHLRGTAGEIVALCDVIVAKLFHALDPAVHHPDDFIFRHRRHVNGHIAFDLELSVGNVVEPAVAPPLQILGGGRNVA